MWRFVLQSEVFPRSKDMINMLKSRKNLVSMIKIVKQMKKPRSKMVFCRKGVKHLWTVAFEKSCSFGFNCTITDTICQNNFLAYHQLILLYYFHQKILKEKVTIFNTLLWSGLFFSSLRKPGLWISRLYIFFPWHYEFSQIQSKHVCIIYASLDRESLGREL